MTPLKIFILLTVFQVPFLVLGADDLLGDGFLEVGTRKVMFADSPSANHADIDDKIPSRYKQRVNSYGVGEPDRPKAYSREAKKFLQFFWDANDYGQFSEIPEPFKDLEKLAQYFSRNAVGLVGELTNSEFHQVIRHQQFFLTMDLVEQFQQDYDAQDFEGTPLERLTGVLESGMDNAIAAKKTLSLGQAEYFYHDILGNLLGDAFTFLEVAVEEIQTCPLND